MRPTHPGSTSHRLRTAGAALLVGLALAGCGVRIETPPPAVPVADAAEQARQDAARTAEQLRAAAAAAGVSADADLTPVLTAVEAASAEHRTALGGVWAPWPGAGPDATAYPGPDATPSPTPTGEDATPADVLGLLEEAALAAHDAAVAHDGDLARLLGAVAISRTYLAQDLAAALGEEASGLPAAPLAAPGPGELDPDTSVALDAARYALEVVAARTTGAERTRAVERADHLEEVASAVAPEDDRREVAYDITAAAQGTATSEHALAATAELDVVRAYIALLAADGARRADVLAAAVDAAAAARSWSATLPALPGLS